MSEVWDLCKAFIHVQGITALTREIAKEPIMKIVEKTGTLGSHWASKRITLEDVHFLNQKLALLNIQMKAAWNASGRPLDALLWVTAPNPALPIDEWTDTTFTAVFNAVDWPAISLPLGMKCDQDVDAPYVDFKPFSAEDARLQALYEPRRFHGLPLSVQLAGQRFEDEKLLAIAEFITSVIRHE
jgi:amidase